MHLCRAAGCIHLQLVPIAQRDCTVQRNHQKMIEESPSPALDEELRARMMDDAVKAARAVGYTSAGTIEFLLDDDRNYPDRGALALTLTGGK